MFSSAGEGLPLLNVGILLLYTLGDDADELADSGIRGVGLDGPLTNGWSCSTKRVSVDRMTSRATIDDRVVDAFGDQRLGWW